MTPQTTDQHIFFQIPEYLQDMSSSLDGSLTITRADDVISGELTVSLRGLDDSDYGEATATFTVPPARVVP